MADLLEQTMPELPIEGLNNKKISEKKIFLHFLEVSKKNNERIGIDFYMPGRSDDVSI
jgi:hypothetical protein